jgi:hypothetical protein
MLNFDISYWDLIKYPYFADAIERGDRGWNEMGQGWKRGMTFRITLIWFFKKKQAPLASTIKFPPVGCHPHNWLQVEAKKFTIKLWSVTLTPSLFLLSRRLCVSSSVLFLESRGAKPRNPKPAIKGTASARWAPCSINKCHLFNKQVSGTMIYLV